MQARPWRRGWKPEQESEIASSRWDFHFRCLHKNTAFLDFFIKAYKLLFWKLVHLCVFNTFCLRQNSIYSVDMHKGPWTEGLICMMFTPVLHLWNPGLNILYVIITHPCESIASSHVAWLMLVTRCAAGSVVVNGKRKRRRYFCFLWQISVKKQQ